MRGDAEGEHHPLNMKVALIIEWLDAWRGGAETSTMQFLNHVLAAGVEVHVFTRSRPSPTRQLHVHTISGAAMSRLRRSMTFAHRAAAAVRREHFDVIHAVSPCFVADIYEPRGGTVAETVERNLALLRSDITRNLKRLGNRLNLKQQHHLAVERQLLVNGEARPVVVALSHYVAEQLRRHYSFPPERIRLIRNGVDPDTSSDDERSTDRREIRGELGIDDDHLLVLLIAHNFRLKGLERWLEALSLLVREGTTDVRTAVVGKGESAKWYRTAARLNIAPFVTFTGPSDRVRRFQHAADVLVHPTYYDPCSRVVMEALSTGPAIVTTRWDGASELLTDGVSGFVLDEPEDVRGLADRVRSLRNPELRLQFRSQARQVVPQADMQHHAAEMLALYEEWVKNGGMRNFGLDSTPSSGLLVR